MGRSETSGVRRGRPARREVPLFGLGLEAASLGCRLFLLGPRRWVGAPVAGPPGAEQGPGGRAGPGDSPAQAAGPVGTPRPRGRTAAAAAAARGAPLPGRRAALGSPAGGRGEEWARAARSRSLVAPGGGGGDKAAGAAGAGAAAVELRSAFTAARRSVTGRPDPPRPWGPEGC